jgi:4-amino-4-deoxy-L-arabinose transferase-like glycosyltransferase
MQESPQRTYSGWFYQHWKLGLLIAFSLSLAVRFYLASTLQLFGDEAFYRWESQHLAWAYSDLPPLTALGIKIGTLVGGESTLAVRSLFLFFGVSLPFAIFFLAHPIVGKNRALIGAGLSLLIPFTATVGVMAIPDSLLLTVCALALGMVERACRTDSTLWWLAAGVAACVGFLIHYRFVFLPLSLAPAFLLLPGLRSQFFRPGLWIALLIAALGLIPSLMFNLENEFGAVGFHFSDRHPWSFHIEGLQYPLLQAAIVSPLLFVFMLLALWECLKRALAGESAYGLLGSVSFAYIVGLSLLAPWIDQTSTTTHWSWFGYIPMLVALPNVLCRI